MTVVSRLELLTRRLRVSALPIIVFLNIFSWGFVQVSLPFYVEGLTPGDPAAALRWTGWIMGVTFLAGMLTTPVWIHVTRGYSPRRCLVFSGLLQAAAMALLAVLPTLPQIFMARLLLGLAGPANTYAFMIAGRSGSNVRHEVSMMHSAINIGILVAPLAGAVSASWLGYTTSFLFGAFFLVASAALVRWGAPAVVEEPKRSDERRVAFTEAAAICLVVLVGYVQVFFLNAALPTVLPPLGVAATQALGVGGGLIFLSGVALAVGALLAPAVAARMGERTVIFGGLLGSSVFLAFLGAASSLEVFAGIRLIHVVLVAPVFPILTARVAQWGGNQALGFLNMSRASAHFVGPVLATMLLSHFDVWAMFAVLGLIGVVCVPGAAFQLLRPAAPTASHAR